MKQAATKQEFPLAPLSPWTRALPAILWAALLLTAFLSHSHQQSPYNPVPWWLVVVLGTALLPVGLLTTLVHREISIDGDRLVVAGALFFARTMPVGDLALDRARVLDLGEHTEYKPLLPLGGFTVPGFKAGSYLLRNQLRAFCLLTGTQRVLLLPRHDGKLLLISPEQPQAVLDALRGLATTPAR